MHILPPVAANDRLAMARGANAIVDDTILNIMAKRSGTVNLIFPPTKSSKYDGCNDSDWKMGLKLDTECVCGSCSD